MARSDNRVASAPGASADGAIHALWAAIERGDAVDAFGGIDGAAARAVNEQGRNALMWAAYMRRPAFVNSLRPLCDLAATDDGGRDAIMWAAAGGCAASVGATMDELPKDAWERLDAAGDNAIMIAAKAGHTEALRELTMRHFGTQRHLVEQALIEAVSICPQDALWIAADSGHPAAVAAAVEGSGPSWVDKKGRGALHVAAQYGHVDQVLRLLGQGADPRARHRESHAADARRRQPPFG